MELWAQVLLEVGGPVGVVIFMIIFGRDIISKLIEQSFQSASEKISMCYSDNLARHSKAYELLLNKEFDFFEQTSLYLSDLIVDIQDICTCLRSLYKISNRDNYNNVQELYDRMIHNISKFKSSILIAQSFIPQDLYDCATILVENVQAQCEKILDILNNAHTPRTINENDNGICKIQAEVLANCTSLMSMIKSRLEFLSKQQEK